MFMIVRSKSKGIFVEQVVLLSQEEQERNGSGRPLSFRPLDDADDEYLTATIQRADGRTQKVSMEILFSSSEMAETQAEALRNYRQPSKRS